MVATRVETPAHQPSDRFSIMPLRNRKKKMCQELKVIVLGNAGVGKTSLLAAISKSHPKKSSSLDVDFRIQMAMLNNEIVKLQLWDTADQEKHGAARLPKSYYRRARGVLLVYDASNHQSFVDVTQWAMRLQAVRDATRPLSLVVVANQTCPAFPVVSTAQGQALATLLEASFVEWTVSDGTTPCLDQLVDALSVEKPWRVDFQDFESRLKSLQAPSIVEKLEADLVDDIASETESECEDFEMEIEAPSTKTELLPDATIVSHSRQDSRYIETMEVTETSASAVVRIPSSEIWLFGGAIVIGCFAILMLLGQSGFIA